MKYIVTAAVAAASTVLATAAFGCGGKACGEHGSGPYQGGGYNPVMVLATACLPNDIWKEVKAGGGKWDLNYAYPRVRKNERIVTVTDQCVTRHMPLEYDTLAAAFIRCTIYTGPMAVSVKAARAAHKKGSGATMRRRPDMKN